MVKPVLLRSRHIVQQHLVAFRHVTEIVTEKRRNETLEQKAVWLEKKKWLFVLRDGRQNLGIKSKSRTRAHDQRDQYHSSKIQN